MDGPGIEPALGTKRVQRGARYAGPFDAGLAGQDPW